MSGVAVSQRGGSRLAGDRSREGRKTDNEAMLPPLPGFPIFLSAQVLDSVLGGSPHDREELSSLVCLSNP